MRRVRFIGTVLLLAAAFASAQEATVTYLVGDVDIRTESGAVFMADFGDGLDAGDRVLTRRSGEAELELASGGVVTVAPETVFLVGSSVGAGGERTGRVSAAVGSFAFKFNAALGNEPRIGSTTSVAGVRGTEVRVYVGSDGTTRYEVIEGLLEVEDAGRRVALGPAQAVEVAPGAGAGSVFAFLERPIDYRAWNAGLVDDFLSDPLPTLRGVAEEMRELISEIDRLGPQIDAMFEEFYAERDKLDAIAERDGDEARRRHFDEVVTPIRLRTREAYTDFRFVVLSALSLDQYVLSRLAAELRAAYFLDPDAPVVRAFDEEFAALERDYDRAVVPRLSVTDL
jgi:hypothetical protein